MNLVSAVADWGLGLCPKTPAFHTAPAVHMILSETVPADRPEGNGPAGRSGRVRQGVRIAAGSLKTMIRDRQMFWFSLISGILIIVLFALIYWTRGSIYYDPFLIKILLGNFILWFDPRILPILAFCLFGITFLMAVGSTAAGVTIADLYRVGTNNGISGISEESLKRPESES